MTDDRRPLRDDDTDDRGATDATDATGTGAPDAGDDTEGHSLFLAELGRQMGADRSRDAQDRARMESARRQGKEQRIRDKR